MSSIPDIIIARRLHGLIFSNCCSSGSLKSGPGGRATRKEQSAVYKAIVKADNN